ncbi:MAG: flagellar basal body rod protein FlgF [Sphingomonadales bacterium]|nr:flagellar basal body rod protein FlgF [Sphingomonadales bacterium]
MDRLIYTAMSGLADSMTRQQVIASNMANAQTTGFRAEMVYATPVTLKSNGLDVRAFADGEVRGANMKAGAITRTGEPLDIALAGDDMLAVQASDGTEGYTRRGDLSISPEGVLQTGDGLPVLGASGPISVPPGAKVTIGADGSVLVANPASPGDPPQALDRLKIASTTGTRIAKQVSGLFGVVGGGVLPADDEARVTTGALEQSNVDASSVLVDMVEAQRLFEIRTRVISTARDVDQSGAGLMKISAG